MPIGISNELKQNAMPAPVFLKHKDKLPLMTDEEKLELLASDGMLVKRPLIVSDDFILVGFKEKEWEETL